MRYFVLLLLLAGCAAVPTERAARIQEATADMVRGCTNLGPIVGADGAFYGHEGVRNAKVRATEIAVDLNATHVLFTDISTSTWSGVRVKGAAYRCPK